MKNYLDNTCQIISNIEVHIEQFKVVKTHSTFHLASRLSIYEHETEYTKYTCELRCECNTEC